MAGGGTERSNTNSAPHPASWLLALNVEDDGNTLEVLIACLILLEEVGTVARHHSPAKKLLGFQKLHRSHRAGLNTATLCANISETSRSSTITVGRGKTSHFDEHKQDKQFFRSVGSFGA